MRSLQEWFAAYQVSHQHPTNKTIHYVCVPAIVWSILALLWSVKLGTSMPWLCNAAVAIAVPACMYYLTLSKRLGVMMALLLVAGLATCHALERALPAPLWQPALAVFAVAWVGQFWGHKIEGRKPSFLQDVQFLLIGPLWVLAHLSGDDRV